jgi:SAM-dependent methyltransferase
MGGLSLCGAFGAAAASQPDLTATQGGAVGVPGYREFAIHPSSQPSRQGRREHFLPGVELERVYHDDAVTTQTGPGGMTTSSSSQPSIMALTLAQLDPQPGDRVLEIGAGTGYNAALLAHLVGPGGQVTTIDLDPAITQAARANLDQAGVGADQVAEVEVRTGDRWLGAADIVEVQPGLLATVDQVDEAQLALLRRLLATTPVREAAPPLPESLGWFARLALDEPDAIHLLAPGDGDEEERRGLFDPTPTNPGLALVLQNEGRLAGFGDQASLSRLRAHCTVVSPSTSTS